MEVKTGAMKRAAIVLAAILMGDALVCPDSASAHGRFPEFVYTSSETIHQAQDILVRLKYLERGRYKEGEWDPPTRKATRDFQRDHFLKPSGQLDRDTLAVLLSHEPRPDK